MPVPACQPVSAPCSARAPIMASLLQTTAGGPSAALERASAHSKWRLALACLAPTPPLPLLLLLLLLPGLPKLPLPPLLPVLGPPRPPLSLPVLLMGLRLLQLPALGQLLLHQAFSLWLQHWRTWREHRPHGLLLSLVVVLVLVVVVVTVVVVNRSSWAVAQAADARGLDRPSRSFLRASVFQQPG